MTQFNTMSSRPGRVRARGFSLLTAVFLLVVLAGLGAAMVNVFTVQQASSSLDLMGAQAYQAARSGIEWGLYQQLRVKPPDVSCFSDQSFALPGTGALRQFSVSVLCQVPNAGGNTAGSSTNRWKITATACNQPAAGVCPNPNPSPDYVQRVVQVAF